MVLCPGYVWRTASRLALATIGRAMSDDVCSYCGKQHDNRLACPEYAGRRVLIVDTPTTLHSEWARELFLRHGGEVVPLHSVAMDIGYMPAFVAYDELGTLEAGRMTVTGKFTSYFDELPELPELDERRVKVRPSGHWLSAPRKWKRLDNRLRKPIIGRKSKGWRRHVRRAKAKRK
jgi:hypothetical protein